MRADYHLIIVLPIVISKFNSKIIMKFVIIVKFLVYHEFCVLCGFLFSYRSST